MGSCETLGVGLWC